MACEKNARYHLKQYSLTLNTFFTVLHLIVKIMLNIKTFI